ncbi:proclotting enzyme-like [Stegodyphus dumicola]|uniref:proclotting enzyme-like n=1 Tax=Stegodyphus dumicola TaxID=202533 RepID=UPI0015AE26D5|nr:proclotting enzyme-like [Stegodyphus dumicola]
MRRLQGQLCSTATVKAGICVPFQRCRNLRGHRRLYRSSTCNLGGKTPRICCPLSAENEVTLPSSTLSTDTLHSTDVLQLGNISSFKELPRNAAVSEVTTISSQTLLLEILTTVKKELIKNPVTSINDDNVKSELNSTSNESGKVLIPEATEKHLSTSIENKNIKPSSATGEQKNARNLERANDFIESQVNRNRNGRQEIQQLLPQECGQSKATFRRIVGGQDSVIGAWPWMAVLYYITPRGRSAECGGVLITEKHILTAAHCVVISRSGATINPRRIAVVLGDYDIESDDDGVVPVQRRVHSIIKYNSFDLRTFQHDIAILILNSAVEFNSNVACVCLPFETFHGDDLAERNAFVAGWGTTSYGGPASAKLQEVQLKIWENNKCKQVFRRDVPITQVNLCAGDGSKDSCRGDSGGPMMLAGADGRFYLVGIVSFGKKCAEPGYPGVYTRVSHYLDWIRKHIEETL